MDKVRVSYDENIGEEDELEEEVNVEEASITSNEFCQDAKYVKNWKWEPKAIDNKNKSL